MGVSGEFRNGSDRRWEKWGWASSMRKVEHRGRKEGITIYQEKFKTQATGRNEAFLKQRGSRAAAGAQEVLMSVGLCFLCWKPKELSAPQAL